MAQTKKTKALLLAAALTASISAHADNTSTTSAPTASSGLLDKVSLVIAAGFAGPAVTNLNSMTPDADMNLSPERFDTQFVGGYKLAPNLEVGAAAQVLYQPVQGHDLTFANAWLRAQRSKILPNGPFSLTVDLRAYTPATAALQAQNFLTGFRTSQAFNYTTGKLTLGTYSFVRQNIYSTAEDGVKLHTFYVAPNASYSLSDNVQATLWVDLIQLNHFKGDTGFFGTNAPWDIEPGINWDVTKSISFNPYVNFFPGNFSMDNTYVGFNLTAKAL